MVELEALVADRMDDCQTGLEVNGELMSRF